MQLHNSLVTKWINRSPPKLGTSTVTLFYKSQLPLMLSYMIFYRVISTSSSKVWVSLKLKSAEVILRFNLETNLVRSILIIFLNILQPFIKGLTHAATIAVNISLVIINVFVLHQLSDEYQPGNS